MWNPFRSVKLKPIVPSSNIQPAVGPETTDPEYRNQVETAQLRSLSARTQISMIHEHLASQALVHIRGGKICPD